MDSKCVILPKYVGTSIIFLKDSPTECSYMKHTHSSGWLFMNIKSLWMASNLDIFMLVLKIENK